MLRCDGTDPKDTKTPDLTAIFVSFPYFDVGKGSPPHAPKDQSVHVPRGLFQSTYPQEAAQERDADQMFCRFKHRKKGEYLRVPQLWALVLQPHIIITCGLNSLPEMFDGAVEFVTEDAFLVDGPSVVHVTDWLKRVVYLSVQRCGTYLSLQRSIEEECLEDLEETINDCIIHVGESEAELEAGQWPVLLKAKDSAFVYVRLSRRSPTVSPPHDDTSLDRTTFDTRELIEYGDLSSDDGFSDDDQMALTIRRDR